MLFKTIDQCSHAVIPELDGRRVQGNEDPWPADMLEVTGGDRAFKKG